jgi:DNA-binding MarR family transcriptional regulator
MMQTENDPDYGGAEANLGYALKQTHHLMRTAIENRARSAGLAMTFPNMAALFLLSETPGLSGAQLARWAMVTPQTMNQILLRLEADGWIVREPDPEHGRILRARVTELGGQEFERGCVLADGLIEEAQAGLSAAERSELLRLLGKCQDNLLHIARTEKAPLEDIEARPIRRPGAKSPRPIR